MKRTLTTFFSYFISYIYPALEAPAVFAILGHIYLVPVSSYILYINTK